MTITPSARDDSYQQGRILPATLPDWYAWQLLREGGLLVDLDTGAITRPNGARAETVERRSGYGRVAVRRRPRVVLAMAHRVVWMAAHGPIPAGLQINHDNRRRWDNRLSNLELTTPGGNIRHAFGERYEHVDSDNYEAFAAVLAAGPEGRPRFTDDGGVTPWPPAVRFGSAADITGRSGVPR